MLCQHHKQLHIACDSKCIGFLICLHCSAFDQLSLFGKLLLRQRLAALQQHCLHDEEVTCINLQLCYLNTAKLVGLSRPWLGTTLCLMLLHS